MSQNSTLKQYLKDFDLFFLESLALNHFPKDKLKKNLSSGALKNSLKHSNTNSTLASGNSFYSCPTPCDLTLLDRGAE